MITQRVISTGLSLAGSVIVGAIAHSTHHLAPQVFLISALAGVIFGVILSATINFGPFSKLGHIIYPTSISICAFACLNLFVGLKGSPIGHWEFMQNRVIGEVGAIAGFNAGLLLGHVFLNLRDLFPSSRIFF